MRSGKSNIERLLNSKKEDDQLLGLRKMGIEVNEKPSDEAIKRAAVLLETGNNSIKDEAIFALCIHWAIPIAYPHILEIVCKKQDEQEILAKAALSLPRYKNSDFFNKEKSLEALAKIVLDKDMNPDVRGVSYISMLEIVDLIKTPNELAKMPDNINELDVNWDWVYSLSNT